MKEIKKKLNSYINISIVSALLLVALGVIFLVAPSTSLDVIRWIIAIFCLAIGAYFVIADFRRGVFSLFSTAFLGVMFLIIGLVFAVQPEIMNIFPIVIGAWFIVSAVTSGRFVAIIRGTASASFFAIIATVLALACGILLIVNPWGGQIAMVTFSGIMMIVYGVASLVDLFVLKYNVEELAKGLKSGASKK